MPISLIVQLDMLSHLHPFPLPLVSLILYPEILPGSCGCYCQRHIIAAFAIFPDYCMELKYHQTITFNRFLRNQTSSYHKIRTAMMLVPAVFVMFQMLIPISKALLVLLK